MNIDFPPPSNGIYNNAGSSRRLVNYMAHEDMERIKKGLQVEDFFNLHNDKVGKADIIEDIDNNIGQLMKTDAKFYAIHINPSAQELAIMGKTEEEQATAMKKYVREVFIPAYAKNFNKDLSAEDIKFYGKIHFERERSTTASFMHCHLIVSRKDQSNKKKLSPLTNHRNTKKGAITGGFNRVALFQQAEAGFDRLFGYNRKLKESFEYCNTMKNGKIEDKLEMQEREKPEGISIIDKVQNVADALTINPIHNISIVPNISLFDGGEDHVSELTEEEKREWKRKKRRGLRR